MLLYHQEELTDIRYPQRQWNENNLPSWIKKLCLNFSEGYRLQQIPKEGQSRGKLRNEKSLQELFSFPNDTGKIQTKKIRIRVILTVLMTLNKIL